MRTNVITRWDVLFIIAGFFLVVYPHIQVNFIWQMSTQQTINPTYFSGLIAYLAIVFALVTGIVVTRRSDTSFGLIMMILINWAVVLYGADSLFQSALGKKPDTGTITWIMSAFFSTHWTAGGLIVSSLWSRKTT